MAVATPKKKTKLKGGIEHSDLICTTPEFRLVYPALFEAKGSPQNPERLRFSATMLFDKDINFKQAGTTSSKSISKVIYNAKVALWGKDKDEWPMDRHGESLIESPIKDGEDKVEKWGEAFEDMWYVKADSTFKPIIKSNVARKNKSTGKTELVDILDPTDIYSGCYCRAVIKAAAYDMGEGSIGVKFYLQMIQKLRDGDSLEGGMDAEEHFGVEGAEVEAEEDEEDQKPKKRKTFDDRVDEYESKKKKRPADDDNDFKSSKSSKKKKSRQDDDDED